MHTNASANQASEKEEAQHAAAEKKRREKNGDAEKREKEMRPEDHHVAAKQEAATRMAVSAIALLSFPLSLFTPTPFPCSSCRSPSVHKE
jgi:hypothetical protein